MIPSAFKWLAVAICILLSACDTGLVLVAADSFDVDLRNGWGATDSGGEYTLVGGPWDFDVSAGVGTITMRRPASPRGAYLEELSLIDSSVLVRVSTDRVPSGARQFIYVAMRRSETSEYLAKLSFAPDGSVFVEATYLLRGANETEISLGSEIKLDQAAHEPGAWFNINAEVRGTDPSHIRIRAWRDGSNRPEWQIRATVDDEHLQGEGCVGLRAYVGGQHGDLPVTMSFDDLRVGL